MIQLKNIIESLNLESAGNHKEPETDLAPVQFPNSTIQQRAMSHGGELSPIGYPNSTVHQQAMRHLTTEEKKKLMEMVGSFNSYNKIIYREGKLTDVARDLNEILRLTEAYLVTESNDFVESNTAKRHINEIRKYCDGFAKLAEEVEGKQRQLEALYKDMGTRLEHYFEIKNEEPIEEVNEAQSVVPTDIKDRMSPSIRDPRTINPVTTKRI
jgi:hypothetical protein